MVVYDSLTDAYLDILRDVYEHPDCIRDAIRPEDIKKRSDNPVINREEWYFNKDSKQEKINYSFTIKEPSDTENIITSSQSRNKIIYEYSSKETVLFDKGDRVGIKQLSKVWQRIANPDGTVNANYGFMVYHLKDCGNPEYTDPEQFMSQWEWAKNRLLLSKETNQAYIHFNRPKDQWNENLDQPCCMNIQFQIRNNRVCLYVNMRSNDLVYGVPYNMLYFVKLMHRMISELKDVYPELVIGDYFYHTASLHFYLKHTSKVKDMLGIC